jgi:hydroxypyruvate reductase 1
MVNSESLALMKPDAVLVNTSRGPVIDEEALVDHLKANPEFRAGLDVFEKEPELAEGLAGIPNCSIVPHIASATTWTREGMATLAACNVAAVLQGFGCEGGVEIGEFLDGDVPQKAPSILNATDLGL